MRCKIFIMSLEVFSLQQELKKTKLNLHFKFSLVVSFKVILSFVLQTFWLLFSLEGFDKTLVSEKCCCDFVFPSCHKMKLWKYIIINWLRLNKWALPLGKIMMVLMWWFLKSGSCCSEEVVVRVGFVSWFLWVTQAGERWFRLLLPWKFSRRSSVIWKHLLMNNFASYEKCNLIFIIKT